MVLRARVVLLVRRVRPVLPVQLDLQDPWVPAVCLESVADPVPLVPPDPLVLMDNLAQAVLPAQLDLLDHLVSPDVPDLRERLVPAVLAVPPVPRESAVSPAHLVPLVSLVCRALLVSTVSPVLRDLLVLLVPKDLAASPDPVAHPVTLVAPAPSVPRDHLVPPVCPDSREMLAPRELTVSPERSAHLDLLVRMVRGDPVVRAAHLDHLDPTERGEAPAHVVSQALTVQLDLRVHPEQEDPPAAKDRRVLPASRAGLVSKVYLDLEV